MSSFGGNRWGDDEEDDAFLPTPQETPVDAKGFKTRTEYKFDNRDQKIKVVSKIRVVDDQTRMSHRSMERRQRLAKFGKARDTQDESNVTIIDYNEVKLLNPKASEAEDEGQIANISDAFATFQKKQQWRALQRQYDTDEPMDGEGPQGESKGESGLGSSGKYVPPGARGGSRMGSSLSAMATDDRDQKTIRVSNLSDETKEADLQELFERFGRIYRIYLAVDKQTNLSRGFAFINFDRREDAERAMEALQGYGYDHLILKLEWAKPSTKDPNAAGSEGTQFRSGYGKALAQDTDQKVSYASNLTA